jgi:alcohol dehydrogenase
MTHALEAYLSSQATPLTDAIALQAIEMIARNLCTSVLSHDMESKAEMLLAASMANIACGNAGLGLVHATNSVITYYYKSRGLPPVAYGLIHAILLPHVLEFNLPACERKLPALANALGTYDAETPEELVEGIVERVEGMLTTLGAPRRLSWEAVSAEDVVEEGIRLGRFHLDLPSDNPNPRKYTRGELVSILEKVL